MFDLKDVRPKGFKRTRRVNGEKVIEFTAIPMPENESTFDLIVEEASVNVLDDKYIIKKLTEQSRGKTYIKNVTAIYEFFVTLINKQQPTIHNGSITFNNYMNLVFEDTPYTFVAIDFFPAREFENLGNDNRLALLQKGLDRFQAEFEIVGNQVRFKQQIGNDTDFQFRYGHNIKAINVDIDTTNLATRIRGTGDPELGIEAEYTSPNSVIYGIIDAPPVNDERFKSEETLLEEMKRRLQDEPQITITVDFVDLRAAGYPYTVPNEGDRVWLIYEPMNDLLIETRIMEIVEYFKYDEENDEFVVIKTEVTLSNDKKTFAGTMFDNVRKQLRQIVNDDGIIKYSALDEAVKIATEALQRAQTELIFENGIIARDKNNPNRVVLFNSEGIGISDDGGNTFREAITADGFVLSAGAIGSLSANHIAGGMLSAQNDRVTFDLNNGFLNIKQGAISIERPDGFVVINDGIQRRSGGAFTPSPSFVSGQLQKTQRMWRNDNGDTVWRDIEAYYFNHISRYIVIHIDGYVEENTFNARTEVRANDFSPGYPTLAQVSMTSTDPNNPDARQMLIDLGTPTGSLRAIILQMRSSSDLRHSNARIRYVALEG